jgi:DNA-binding response OmpR family regulator
MNRRFKILIVDNDEDVLIALERVLQEQGYDTTTAWDLPEGREIMTSEDFDLLLMGDHPPDLNCERLLKMLRGSHIAVPCIVMHSAARYPFSDEYLRHLGAQGVACKWNYNGVAEVVGRCLKQPREPVVHAVAGRAS